MPAARREAKVVKFKPTRPDGLTDRELLEAAVRDIATVHRCVDSFKTEQSEVNATLTRQIAGIKTTQEMDSGRITALAKRLGAEKREKGEKVSVGIGGWPWWKAAGAGLGVLSGAVLAFQLLAPAVTAFAVALYQAAMAQ